MQNNPDFFPDIDDIKLVNSANKWGLEFSIIKQIWLYQGISSRKPYLLVFVFEDGVDMNGIEYIKFSMVWDTDAAYFHENLYGIGPAKEIIKAKRTTANISDEEFIKEWDLHALEDDISQSELSQKTLQDRYWVLYPRHDQNTEEIKDSTTWISATKDEAYKIALEWLAEFKETVAVYTGILFIPNAVFRLLAISDPEMAVSVGNAQEDHNKLVSASITLEEKARMRKLRQNIYGECEYVLTKLYKAQHTDSRTLGDADMPTMEQAEPLTAKDEILQLTKERHKAGNPISAKDFKDGVPEEIMNIAKKHSVSLDTLRNYASKSPYYLSTKPGRPVKQK